MINAPLVGPAAYVTNGWPKQWVMITDQFVPVSKGPLATCWHLGGGRRRAYALNHALLFGQCDPRLPASNGCDGGG
ncbi:hypothetical protein TomTYG45_02210 [Sphingobium sp. TomTYG45]